MLEPSDLEAIRAVIREEIGSALKEFETDQKLERERKLHAERQRRYRERKETSRVTVSDGRVTKSDGLSEEKRDAVRDAKDSPPLLPLFPPHTPPITLSSPTSSNTHKKYARAPASFEEVKIFVTEKLKLTEDDAIVLWEHWVGNGFKVNGRPMNSWKHTASKWERLGFVYPSLQEKNKNQHNNGYKNR